MKTTEEKNAEIDALIKKQRQEEELARQADQAYLDSIDPEELAAAKEMFSSIKIPVDDVFTDFIENLKDFSESNTDNNENYTDEDN